MPATLLTQRGSVRVDREALSLIEPPAPTATWKPVKHGELVDRLTQVLAAKGRAIAKEEFALQRDGKVLFGVMDLQWGQTDDYHASLGLRTANDKTMSIQIAIGARIMVCDNLLFSGELIALKRKHTSGLDLEKELTAAIARYDAGYGVMTTNIDRLKHLSIDFPAAQALLFEVFAQKIMPLRCFPKVVAPYVHSDDDGAFAGSQWDILDRLTDYATTLSPAVRFATVTKLGQFFGLSDTADESERIAQ